GYLNSVFGSIDWSLLKGLVILEIGCGSPLTHQGIIFQGYNLPVDYWYDPYFCYLCAAYGAEVYGLDLYPLSQAREPNYTHIQCDITELVRVNTHFKSFPRLPDLKRRCDLVYARHIAGDYELIRTWGR